MQAVRSPPEVQKKELLQQKRGEIDAFLKEQDIAACLHRFFTVGYFSKCFIQM